MFSPPSAYAEQINNEIAKNQAAESAELRVRELRKMGIVSEERFAQLGIL